MTSSSFVYQNGVFCAEATPLSKLAEEVGTPFYCYSTEQLRQNYRAFAEPFAKMKATIHYANKANANLAVSRALAHCGAGADVTSAGELERALMADVSPDKIVFSGVGKTHNDVMAALLADICQINAESLPEIAMISRVAAAQGKTASLGLRINPDVNAGTYQQTSTGHKETKFGIDKSQLDEAVRLATTLPGLNLKGFTVHVGSHVYDYEPFRLAFQMLADAVRHYRSKGVPIDRVDLGGGVTIPYDGKTLPPFAGYAAIVHEVIAPLNCEISFEPGRRLVGDAGILISRVTFVKETPYKKFLILDAGMNDLVRPAMYGARHTILPVLEPKSAVKTAETVAVVGPICETSDMFGEDYSLGGVREGDLVAILQAGAYGAAMSGNYNGRALIPEVLVSKDNYAIVRRRIAVAEQIAWEAMPSWI